MNNLNRIRKLYPVFGFCGILLYFFLSSRLAAQEYPPLIGTQFVIADTVFSDVKPSRKDSIMILISDEMARQCEHHFSFLRWASVYDSLQPDQPKKVLVLEIMENQKSIRPDIKPISSYHLNYNGQIEDQIYPVPLTLEDEILYGIWDEKPSHNPSKLLENIRVKLDVHFRSESYRSNLHESFLSDIPLTQKIHVDQELHRLIVPIKWHALQASSESKLEVQFIAGERELWGIMTLKLEEFHS